MSRCRFEFVQEYSDEFSDEEETIYELNEEDTIDELMYCNQLQQEEENSEEEEDECSVLEIVSEILKNDFLHEYYCACENIYTEHSEMELDIFHAIISHSHIMTDDYILERLQEEFEMNDFDAELEIVSRDILPGQILPWDNNQRVSYYAQKCFHLKIQLYFECEYIN
jgi:hypothetical protein